jgi:hypothetical protein
MRVLAAAFGTPAAARRALDELRDRYALRPDDAGIAPLGDDIRDEDRTVLAGRFHEDALVGIHEIVGRHGGEVVSDVDEAWTHSPDTGRPTDGTDGASPTGAGESTEPGPSRVFRLR